LNRRHTRPPQIRRQCQRDNPLITIDPGPIQGIVQAGLIGLQKRQGFRPLHAQHDHCGTIGGTIDLNLDAAQILWRKVHRNPLRRGGSRSADQQGKHLFNRHSRGGS
jgi:hypothetical protein